MKITKYGHCCLLIEIDGVKILTDPGTYTTKQNEITGIDIVLITHEHGDHFHIDSVKKILENNPEAKIITNSAVGKLLDKENIAYGVVEDGQSNEVEGIRLEGFGTRHAEIFKEMGQVENTGYFIGGKLFYPGDSYTNPGKQVEILALPVAGPWVKIGDALNYCIEVKPKIAFPVHDAGLKSPGFINQMVPGVLKEYGIEFIGLEIEKETEI